MKSEFHELNTKNTWDLSYFFIFYMSPSFHFETPNLSRRQKSQSIGAEMHFFSFQISYKFEYFYQCIIFFESEGIQGTHMDALIPFSSKLMTLLPMEGL